MRVVVGIERGYLVVPLSLTHTFYISQPAAMISSSKFLGWSHRTQKYTIDGCFYQNIREKPSFLTTRHHNHQINIPLVDDGPIFWHSLASFVLSEPESHAPARIFHHSRPNRCHLVVLPRPDVTHRLSRMFQTDHGLLRRHDQALRLSLGGCFGSAVKC